MRKVGKPWDMDPAAGAARLLLPTTLAAAAFAAVLHASPASAVVQPSSLEFGDVPFGGASAPRTVQIFAPYPAVLKTILGYDRFQVSQTDCVPFRSTQCWAAIVATNSMRLGPFGRETGRMVVQYTYGDNPTDYITVSANFLPPPPPKTWLSVGDVTVTEGNAGTRLANFVITRSGDTSGSSSVSYATTDGKATAGQDYVAVPRTYLQFNPGETTKVVSVAVKGDTLAEGNEFFFLTLTNPGPYSTALADNIGTATVVDDDGTTVVPGPSTWLSVGDAALPEGNSGNRTMLFTVTRAGNTSGTSSVRYTVNPGTASAGSDYLPGSIPGTITFAPGETAKTLPVTIVGDTVKEADETFFVELYAPTGAALADDRGVGTIVNDD